MNTYFIQEGQRGPIKIGKSMRVLRRRGNLQGGNSQQLILLGKIDGNHESNLHAAWREYRIHGEWFRRVDTLLQCVLDISCLEVNRDYIASQLFDCESDPVDQGDLYGLLRCEIERPPAERWEYCLFQCRSWDYKLFPNGPYVAHPRHDEDKRQIAAECRKLTEAYEAMTPDQRAEFIRQVKDMPEVALAISRLRPRRRPH